MSHTLKSISLIVACLALLPVSSMRAQAISGQLLGGSLNSPVKIEVFSDFQCPHCRDLFLDTIKPLLLEYSSKDKVCVIYHEFPLAGNQYSREAARYVEAAAPLGQQKLIALYDSIFTDQPQWAQNGKLEESVSKALSREDFLQVVRAKQNPGINAAIEKEIQLGMQNKVDSTPTMFISYIGKEDRVVGFLPYVALKQFIDKIVK